MQNEMQKLESCFSKGLADVGGLSALHGLDARSAAELLDASIDRCASLEHGLLVGGG